jgi:hypothetical protein
MLRWVGPEFLGLGLDLGFSLQARAFARLIKLKIGLEAFKISALIMGLKFFLNTKFYYTVK